MISSLRELVVLRATNRCEYCQLKQLDTLSLLEVEHIIARKHRGLTEQSNLCLACVGCNQFKGSNIAGIDPESGQLVRLFHPRVDIWHDHFRWDGELLLGLTSIGRTTIDVLRINEPERVDLRISLSG